MILGNKQKTKAGVSLVTVLLFMLVATIAATATYKWLSSEGFSSASRMMKREAYQSAVAGIENARAWMTFHANETGALLKQYIYDDDGKPKATRTPINLDAQIRSFAQGSKQDHHVWLTGVNTNSSTYKVQILSEGVSRNGQARHTEVAILNVDGLYQVKKPKKIETVTPSSLPYDYNYFGGTTKNAGDFIADAMLVNGDLKEGNPALVKTNMVVTGDFKLSGDGMAVQGNACFGGDADFNNGVAGNNFYIVGNASNLNVDKDIKINHVAIGEKNIYGSLYVEGNINKANFDQVVEGNVTLMGTWHTNLQGNPAGVGGNFCTGPSARIDFDSHDRVFETEGNLWVEGMDLFTWNTDVHDDADKIGKIVLGGEDKKIYSPYIYSDAYYKNTFQVNTTANKIESRERRGCGGQHDCNHFWDQHYITKYKYFKEYAYGMGGPDAHKFVLRGNIPTVTYKKYTNQFWVTNNGDYHDFYAYFINDDTDPFYDNDKIWKELNWNGSSATASTYCKPKNYDQGFKTGLGGVANNDNARPECHFTNWFKSNASTTVEHELPTTKPFECGQSVKKTCDDIWEGEDSEVTGCAGSTRYVPDLLVTAYSKFKPYSLKNCAKAVSLIDTTIENPDVDDNRRTFDAALVDEMNKCYKDIDEENLYNGYLVVRVKLGANPDADQKLLKGKFIIIFTNEPTSGSIKFPKNNAADPRNAESDSYAFVYFEQGTGGTYEIIMGDTTTHKYFLYTTKDLYRIQGSWTGSVYGAVGTPGGSGNNCAKVPDMVGVKRIKTDSDFLTDLATAGILCPSEKGEAACGGSSGGSGSGGSGGSGGSTEGYEVGKLDSYFISNAPQLGVTIESQYKSSESAPVSNGAGSAIKPSFIVLPRIIYLNRDPYGKLSDYYNVISLNGANVTKENANVSCSPLLNVNSKMVEGTEKLTEGIYECSANPSGYNAVPFWVWVQGSQQSSPRVSFVTGSYPMQPGNATEVKISVPPHSSEITVLVNCPDAPTGWTVLPGDDYDGKDGSICKFKFAADISGHSTPTIFTVTPDVDSENGSITYTLQTPEENAGYQIWSPWSTSLSMSTTVVLTNTQNVLPTDIETWCASHSGCPAADMRSSWPDCPRKNSAEWVVPDWSLGYKSDPSNKNVSWNVVTGGTSESVLKLKENTGSGCVVIIPDGDKINGPIVSDGNYSLRAVAKARSNKIKLSFMGVETDKNPYVTVSVVGSSRTIPSCNYNDNSDHTCTISVFDGEKVKISINKEGSSDNAKFSYWQCQNGGGSSCPTTDPISSVNFGGEDGFSLRDDNAVVEIHFGEQDKHCFFDEFRRTRTDNTTHSCGSAEETEKETEYCIGTGTKAKWKLAAGMSINDVEKDPYQGYIVAKKNAPNTGVKIMSTVDAGIRGTLKALVQVPHATASYGKDSPKIKNSGFLLRSDVAGSSFLMLNVYENTSGYLAARLCLDGGTTCTDEIELLRNGVSRANVTTSSMVMLSAKLEGEATLKLKAYTGSFYNSGAIEDAAYYKAEFNLGNLGNNHASMAYKYVGLSLAHRDFKVYGIGWESEDYASECFDGPPSVKCSFAAVAVGGIIPTYGTDPGQSTAYQVPWVGHSGWFDSKDCAVSYSYVPGSATNDATVGDGYQFDQTGAGAHGYKGNDGNDVKTAYASLANCYYTKTNAKAWETTVDPAHCGPFWTGKYEECKIDASLLDINEPYSLASGYDWSQAFAAKNLRGVGDLAIVLLNESEDPVDLEFWLESKSNSWGSTNYESRHGRITGNTGHFRVAASGSDYEELSDNATGFDPENVVAIVFKNNGANTVKIKSAQAMCKNAVEFDGCSVVQEGETGWKMTLSVSKNADKLSKVTVKAKVGGSNYTLSKSEFDDGNLLEFVIPDAGIYSNAGKSYSFEAQVYSAVNEYTSEFKTCGDPISVGAITCGNASLTPSGDVEENADNNPPQYHFELSGCPSKGCAYEVYLNGSKIKECTNTQATSSEGCPGNPNTTINVTGTQKLPVSTTSYTYEVRNTTSSPTLISNVSNCTKTFNVVEHVPSSVSCNIGTASSTASGSDLGAESIIPKANVTVSCEGGGCKYTVMEGTSSASSQTEYASNYDLNFTGSREAGSHTYTVVMQRGTEAPVACSGSYTVTYPLNLSCGTFTDPGASTPIDAGTAVVPKAPTIPSGTYSGCNGKCSYNVTGGSATGGSSSSYDGTSTMNSFVDNDGSGSVDYTLTVNGPGNTSLTCTPLTVTYTSGSSESEVCECTCGGDRCEHIELTASGDNNHQALSHCYFVDDGNAILRLTTLCSSIKINGISITETHTADTPIKNYVTETKDGGYYLEIIHNGSPDNDRVYCNYYINHTSEFNPCVPEVKPVLTDCPVASTTIAPEGYVTVTPTSTGCNTKNGCTYTIGGDFSTSGTYRSGTIRFAHSGTSNGDEKTYTLTLSNGKGSSATCTMDVITYATPTTTTIPTSGDVSLSAGTHSITCTAGKVVSCGHYIGDYVDRTMTIDGVACTVAQEINWNRCGFPCTGEAQTLETGVAVRCRAL